jgi:hypothetical protein
MNIYRAIAVQELLSIVVAAGPQPECDRSWSFIGFCPSLHLARSLAMEAKLVKPAVATATFPLYLLSSTCLGANTFLEAAL